MQRTVRLVDELLGATTKDNRRSLGIVAAGEQVVALVADLLLLEKGALAQVFGLDLGRRRLHRRTRGQAHALHVVGGDAASTEDVAVGEILRREVANRQSREDHLRAGRDALLELVVDDAPLGVDDGLILLRVLDASLGTS